MNPSVTKLLAWYGRHKRDLPWRTTCDPYRIFISELMLQQTQVDRVVPKYRAFLKTFPTWKRLAEAKTADLLHAWAGLGYNRRALYAREAAREVLKTGVPTDEAGWRRLKGVGPYMATALAEFVNGKRAVVMDTNVRRVAGRVLLGLPFPAISDDKRLRTILERITPRKTGHRELPQAFMDFGNAVCLPRTPKCAECPLRRDCKAAPKFLKGSVIREPLTVSRERIHLEKKYPDRIYRGRILAWIREHGTGNVDRLGPRVDETYDPIADIDWVRAMVGRLVKDGLLAWKKKGNLSLPDE